MKHLKLTKVKNYIDVSRIAGNVEPSNGTVTIQLSARYPSSFRVNLTAIVMSKLMSFLPNHDFDKSIMNQDMINALVLTDPNYNKSAKIDMILVADVYSEIMMSGMIKPTDNAFVAQETELGWILTRMIKCFKKVCGEKMQTGQLRVINSLQ